MQYRVVSFIFAVLALCGSPVAAAPLTLSPCQQLLENQNQHTSPVWKNSNTAKLIQRLEEGVPLTELSDLKNEWISIDQVVAGLSKKDLIKLFEKTNEAAASLSTTISGEDRSDTTSESSDVAKQNYFRARGMVQNWVSAQTPITLEKIIQIHDVLMARAPGAALAQHVFRVKAVSGSGLEYLPSEDIESATNYALSRYDKNRNSDHPIACAALLYRFLISIHPFEDANGRTARLVLDWSLGLQDYPPANFVDKTSAAFFSDQESLNTTDYLVLAEATDGIHAFKWVPPNKDIHHFKYRGYMLAKEQQAGYVEGLITAAVKATLKLR